MKSTKYKTYILISLFVIHVLWMGTHFLLTLQGDLNPWKLGGYAMYTVPKPLIQTDIAVEGNFLYHPVTKAFQNQNWGFNWYCKKISARSLRQLWLDNPTLMGVDTTVLISSERFLPKRFTFEPFVINKLKVVWSDEQHFSFKGLACNRYPYVGEGSLY